MTLADFTLRFVLPLLGLAALLAALRVLRGPSLADRVVALELLTTLGVGLASGLAVQAGEAVFLDLALVLALVAFLGTVAFARYIEKRG